MSTNRSNGSSSRIFLIALLIAIFLCAGIPYLNYIKTPITYSSLVITYDYFLGMFLSMFFIATVSIPLSYWIVKLVGVKNVEGWAEWTGYLLPFIFVPIILPVYLEWLYGTKLNLNISDYSRILLSSTVCPIKFTVIWNKLAMLIMTFGINGTISRVISFVAITGSFIRGLETIVKIFQSPKEQ